VVEHLSGLWLIKNDQTVATLIECALDLFIEDHLRQLHEHLVHGQSDLLSNIVYLDLVVGEDNLLQILLEQTIVQIVEMSADHHIVKQVLLVCRCTFLEHSQRLLLVSIRNLFHGLNLARLVLERNRRIDQVESVIRLLVHDLAEEHKFESNSCLLNVVHAAVAFESLVKVGV